MRIVNFAHGVIFSSSARMSAIPRRWSAAASSTALSDAPLAFGAIAWASSGFFLRPLYGRRDGGAYCCSPSPGGGAERADPHDLGSQPRSLATP